MSLHVGAIEVVAVEVVVGAGEGWKFELVPEVGAEVCEMVDVETRVNVV